MRCRQETISRLTDIDSLFQKVIIEKVLVLDFSRYQESKERAILRNSDSHPLFLEIVVQSISQLCSPFLQRVVQSRTVIAQVIQCRPDTRHDQRMFEIC